MSASEFPPSDGSSSLPNRCRTLSTITLKNSNIVKRLLHRLPIHDIISISQLTRQHRLLTEHYVRRRINAELQHWMTEPTPFLQFLDYCDCVIGGPIVPWLLFGMGERPQTLTLFVGRHQFHFSWISSFLRDRLLYEPIASWKYPDPSDTVARSTLFQKGPDHLHGLFPHLRLIESATRSAIHPILWSPSTMTMNYLTGRRIISLYPRLLQQRIGVLHPRFGDFPSITQTHRNSWSRLGVTMYDSVADLSFPCRELCPTLWRSTADVATFCYRYGAPAYNLSMLDMGAFTWTFSWEGYMPEVRCPNPLCPRTNLMLRRRDKRVPTCPFSLSLSILPM